MMVNTVSRYLYGLTVNSQYLGITVWTVYCPLLVLVPCYRLVRCTYTYIFELRFNVKSDMIQLASTEC